MAAVPVASSFCCTKELEAEPGQSGLSGPGLAPLSSLDKSLGLPCPALPYSQYLAQLSIFVRIPCLSSSAFHVIFRCPHNGHLGIHPSWDRHSVHCVKHSKVSHFVFECTSLQGRASRFVWSVKKSLPWITCSRPPAPPSIYEGR
jgi:hypothetical protein